MAVNAEYGCIDILPAVFQFVASNLPLAFLFSNKNTILLWKRNVIPDLLEAEDCAIPLDRCVAVWNGDCNVIDDVVVYLGLRGLVNDALLEDEMDEGVDVEVFFKNTRAGGN